MRKASRRWIRCLGVALAALLLVAPAFAAPTDLYYERTLMSSAGARCRLFTKELAAALSASAEQARGAALRAGVAARDVDAAAARARQRAGREPCNSPDLTTAAKAARDAFAGYQRLQQMRYPGEILDWNASRNRSASGRVWNLSQQVSLGPQGKDRLTFGLTAKGNEVELIGVVRFADGAQPYAARLITRDTARSSQPYLDTRARRPDGKLPLTARVTPRTATKTWPAQARFAPDTLIRIVGATPSTAYRFPISASNAIARLDPREAVEVEFLFNGREGDTVRRAYLEVGDFAAGRAFMWISAPA